MEDVNLHIDDGEFAFIVGASGAGKSTFLKLIMREEVPTAGEVIVNNYRLTRLKRKEIPYFRRTMGIVFQDFRLINTMTVFDNVAFSMRVIGKKKREINRRVHHVLGLLDLEGKANRFPMELSGGEQQRVCIARALINYPVLILADEPTGNLDEKNEKLVMDLLRELNKEGHTIITVTHSDKVGQAAKRVVIIEHGHLRDA